MIKPSGSILVIDDDFLNRLLIRTNLEERGYEVTESIDGEDALRQLNIKSFDVVLLDLLMPVIDGFEVLRRIKADPRLRHIPVIVISSIEEMGSITRCIEMGAADHLPKPFDPLMLHARINASLVTKRMHDMESAYLEQLQNEQQKSQELLLNILPAPVAEKLKQGHTSIVEQFPSVTVMFADLVGFTPFVAQHTPAEMLDLLNTVFLAFDQLVDQHGLEKIKTIGDAYMVAGGLPIPRPDHLEAVADMALSIKDVMRELIAAKRIPPFQIRIGIHTGPVVAGVIGRRKFAYDLWGDTVNIASRLHTTASGDCIQVSEPVSELLKTRYNIQEQGIVELKGLREMKTFLLLSKRP